MVENDTGGAQSADSNVRTLYGYDALGNRTVITVTNFITNAHTYTSSLTTYDSLNRPVLVKDALGNETVYQYNALGSRTVITDANLGVTLFDYDGLNRQTSEQYLSDDETVTYNYDASGNRTSMTDGLGTTAYSYDDLYRLITVTHPISGAVLYGYDKSGNRTSLTYPDGKQVNYTYDGDNRLERVDDWDDGVTTYAYDGAGRLITTTLPNGVTTTYGYNAANRLTSLVHRGPGGEQLASYTYWLDKVGNRIKAKEILLRPVGEQAASGESMGNTEYGSSPLPEAYPAPPTLRTPDAGSSLQAYPAPSTDADLNSPSPSIIAGTESALPGAGSQASSSITGTIFLPIIMGPCTDDYSCTTIVYEYDPLYRLIEATYTGSITTTLAYQYDSMGNRLFFTKTLTNAQTTTYTYNAANQLTTAKLSTSPDTWHYAYDANGNQIRQVPNGLTPAAGEVRYSYNQANRLVGIDNHDGSAYQLVARITYDGKGNRLQTVAYAGGGPITTTHTLDDLKEGVPLVSSKETVDTYLLYGLFGLGENASEWSYYLGDAQFSVRQLVDAYGEISLSRTYDPFGAILQYEGSEDSLYGFAGTLSGGKGLLFNNGRYFDPATGRFLTPDYNFDSRQPSRTLNPYLAWLLVNPGGLLVGPLLIWGWRKRKGKKTYLALWLLIGLGLATTLVACQEEAKNQDTAIPLASEIVQGPIVPTGPPTNTATSTRTSTQTPSATPRPSETATATCTSTPFATSTSTSTPTPTLTPTPLTVNLPPGVSLLTAQKYTALLYDPSLEAEREPENGSFKDDVLIAIIIAVEYQSVPPDEDAYREALEATSYQYHSDGYRFTATYKPGCMGSCDSIDLELQWLQEMEAFRRTSTDSVLAKWHLRHPDARLAVSLPRYKGPVAADSHVWGNYFEGSPMDHYVSQGAHKRGERASWFDGVPFNAIYESTNFVVMSGAQNRACRDVSCGGF